MKNDETKSLREQLEKYEYTDREKVVVTLIKIGVAVIIVGVAFVLLSKLYLGW